MSLVTMMEMGHWSPLNGSMCRPVVVTGRLAVTLTAQRKNSSVVVVHHMMGEPKSEIVTKDDSSLEI